MLLMYRPASEPVRRAPATPHGLKTGDVCGAIYHTRGPFQYPNLQQAVNVDGTYVPDGDWNSMDIGFMSARYKLNPTSGEYERVKCSTISVIINGVQVHHRIGLDPTGWGSKFNEKARLICDAVYDEPNDPKGYCKASGIILLQEHDTPVQFRNIQMNPTWLPGSGTNFDRNWQRDSGCLPRTF